MRMSQASQRSEGWIPVGDDYDDPAFSGGNMERPGLRRLMADIEARRIDIVVVYKIDRPTRSLADFSKIVEVFERQGVVIRVRHPAIQHHHVHGAADAQRAVLRSVRAREQVSTGEGVCPLFAEFGPSIIPTY